MMPVSHRLSVALLPPQVNPQSPLSNQCTAAHLYYFGVCSANTLILLADLIMCSDERQAGIGLHEGCMSVRRQLGPWSVVAHALPVF